MPISTIKDCRSDACSAEPRESRVKTWNNNTAAQIAAQLSPDMGLILASRTADAQQRLHHDVVAFEPTVLAALIISIGPVAAIRARA